MVENVKFMKCHNSFCSVCRRLFEYQCRLRYAAGFSTFCNTLFERTQCLYASENIFYRRIIKKLYFCGDVRKISRVKLSDKMFMGKRTWNQIRINTTFDRYYF
jgi:hypothetical protein